MIFEINTSGLPFSSETQPGQGLWSAVLVAKVGDVKQRGFSLLQVARCEWIFARRCFQGEVDYNLQVPQLGFHRMSRMACDWLIKRYFRGWLNQCQDFFFRRWCCLKDRGFLWRPDWQGFVPGPPRPRGCFPRIFCASKWGWEETG
jgi:hypothetical protein